MASLIAKWQICGKSTCRCTNGLFHGPYFWLVSYISVKSNDKKKGKYSWTYLGKNPSNVWKKLRTFDSRFYEKYSFSTLRDKIKELHKDKARTEDLKTSESVLEVADTIANLP
jgi:hypothetical protein